MEYLGINAIHPTAPEYLTAAGLFSAPIDVGAAVERIRNLWGEDIQPRWVNVEAQKLGNERRDFDVFPPRRSGDDNSGNRATPHR